MNVGARPHKQQRLAPLVLSAVTIVAAPLLRPSPGHSEPTRPSPSPSAQRFAYRAALHTSGTGPLHSLLLPPSVYRELTSAELADLRVINSSGQTLPHALRLLPHRPDTSAHTSIPFFPLTSTTDEASEKGLAIRVVRDTQGAIIEVQGTVGADHGAAARSAPHGYLLDLSELQGERYTQLDLDFEPSTDFAARVRAERSSDLSHFVAAGQPQSLLRMTYGGQRIERQTIELPPGSQPYVRLTLQDGSTLPSLRQVHVFVQVAASERQPSFLDLQGTIAADPQIIEYGPTGPLALQAVSLRPVEDNTLIEASLIHVDPKGIERAVYTGTAFRVHRNGETFYSPPHSTGLAQHPGRYRLRIRNPQAGAIGAAPVVRLHYDPHQLLFVGKGQEPFFLVFGKLLAPDVAFAPTELLALLPPSERTALPDSSVHMATPHPLAGPAALTEQKPQKPTQYRIYILWALLIAGATTMLVIALNLLRNKSG